jgi:hypothetical protein
MGLVSTLAHGPAPLYFYVRYLDPTPAVHGRAGNG